ncbi:MAG: YgiQ family radical SAM protein [Nitrospinota bacterium]|nr:YgiQ family radical SAM protein [Nitrospinota bacterium]
MQIRSIKDVFLPTTSEEASQRGWNSIDILLITGDAYVDHPSFGIPLIGRWLERLGYRVGIVARPRTDTVEDFKRFGRPTLFIGISSGAVDSMLNNYTANKKTRSDDQYAPGGKGGGRPDYAVSVYTELARRAFPDTPILLGGVEASLRRIAHYDYWMNKVRPSILKSADADLLVYGQGEKTVTEIAEILSKSADETGYVSRGGNLYRKAIEKIQELRGVAYVTTKEAARELEPRLTLPSFKEVANDKKKFARAAYFVELEASPYNGKRLVQYHGDSAVVVNQAQLPISTEEFDSIYTLPFTREQHPSYTEKIPAGEMIKFSIASNRGCFGGCSFCAITLHHGRIVSSRSEKSILQELESLNSVNGYRGQISDIGGPTANMYRLDCVSKEIQSVCRKMSCVFPTICPHLVTDHTPQVKLLEKSRKVPGVKKISIGSGVRYDIAFADRKSGEKYLNDLIKHHVGGQLKIAPEHVDDEVLYLMKKPRMEEFEKFVEFFKRSTQEAGKEQYIIPYFISGFPGSTHGKMKKVHDFLTARRWNVQQVQAFIPTPMTLATAMYWSEMDPKTRKSLWVAREYKDRKEQQDLLQPWKERARKKGRG